MARYFAVHAVRRARAVAFTARHFERPRLMAEARERSTEFRRPLVAALLVLGSCMPARAQQSFTVDSLPATYTYQCDSPTTLVEGGSPDPAKLSFALSVDSGAFAPDVSTCAFVLSVQKAGDHPIAVVARYRQPDGTQRTSAPLNAVLSVTIKTTFTPTAPTNPRIAPAPATPAGGTPAPFTDADGHAWTLVGTDPQIDGKHAGNPGASGTELILLPSGVYILGTDANWYRWSGTGWSPFGKTRPQG